MITEKVKNLFAFIDFLHSKTTYFVSKKALFVEVLELRKKQDTFRPNENYKERIEFKKIQAEIKDKFHVIEAQTTSIILNKALELNIATTINNPSLNLTAYSDLLDLKRNFEEGDIFQINEAKQKYVEFRTKTDCHFFLQMFFNDLDRDLKEFFDYFSEETEQKGLNFFEKKEFQVDSFEDLITAMKYGVPCFLPVDSNLKPNQNNNNINSESIFLNAKERIDKRPASETKSFALSVYFENISVFIDFYANQAKANNKGLGQKADLFLNKCKNRLMDCDTENELRSLLTDCVKGKEEFYNIINNFYENQYKKEFNFFSFNEQTSFDWQEKQNAITHIKYYLEYKYLVNTVNEKLTAIEKKENYLASYLGLKPEFPFYELDYIPKYYESKRDNYLAERKSLLGRAFVERSEIEIFNKNEIQECVNVINYYSNLFSTRPEILKTHKAFVGKTSYKLWIESLISNETSSYQPITKQNPELTKKLITLKNSETIEKIHSELKGYFPNKEAELLKVLQGEQLSEILLFPHNQNKFVEVFRRLKYNGFLLNTDTETKNWICTTFQFVKKGFAEPQPFNESSVWDNLNKGKGEPTRKERICITEWLPYKSPLQLTRETENEKL